MINASHAIGMHPVRDRMAANGCIGPPSDEHPWYVSEVCEDHLAGVLGTVRHLDDDRSSGGIQLLHTTPDLRTDYELPHFSKVCA